MTHQTSLGKLIADESMGRDAIHIAVAPVTALVRLYPGQHIGRTSGNEAAPTIDNIGIVDPFLTVPINPGERFWLFLYPNTITSLRHEWTHPAFDAALAPMATDPKAVAVAWVEAFAAELDQTYNRLMTAADKWFRDEEYTYDNSESYKDVDNAQWRIFWGHYEIIRGVKVKDHADTFFTCSC